MPTVCPGQIGRLSWQPKASLYGQEAPTGVSCDTIPHLAHYRSPGLVTVPRRAGAEEESKQSSPGTLGSPRCCWGWACPLAHGPTVPTISKGLISVFNK